MSKKTQSRPTQTSRLSRQEFREMRQKRRRQERTVIVASIVVVALVVLAIFTGPSLAEALKPVGEIVEITQRARYMADGNAMGDPNAPVRIDEFSDYQCPYCKLFSDQTEQQLEEAYIKTGKVYFVFRSMGNYISQGLNTESQDAAESAYCAGDQGKYWEYHDMLFANWQGENVGSFAQKRLRAFAEKLGLDMTQFNACFKDTKYETAMQEDFAAADAAGVTQPGNGTPAFLINGKLIIGAQSFETFQQEIEAALAAAESQ